MLPLHLRYRSPCLCYSPWLKLLALRLLASPSPVFLPPSLVHVFATPVRPACLCDLVCALPVTRDHPCASRTRAQPYPAYAHACPADILCPLCECHASFRARRASSLRTPSTFLVSMLRTFAPTLQSAYAGAFAARARPRVLSICISRFWARPAPAHIVLLVSRLCSHTRHIWRTPPCLVFPPPGLLLTGVLSASRPPLRPPLVLCTLASLARSRTPRTHPTSSRHPASSLRGCHAPSPHPRACIICARAYRASCPRAPPRPLYVSSTVLCLSPSVVE